VPVRASVRATRARALAAALIATVSVGGLAQAQVDSGTKSPRRPAAGIQRYFDLVRPAFSGERARSVVAFVEQYFRVPGNTGFNASLHHVEAVLRDAGYVEQTKARPGDRLIYRLERRPMTQLTWEPADGSLEIMKGATSPVVVLRMATNRNMLAINSFSTPDAGVEAELVNVGRGTAEEYDRASVAGKIVLGTGNIGRVFTEAVVKRGALGALVYGMPAYTQPELHPTSIQFGSIPQDTIKRSWGIPLSYAANSALLAALSPGPVRVRVRTKTRLYRSEDLTLVAEVRGTSHPDERFVFSAHVQEPGANDNASGVGTLAEMARVLAVLSRDGQAPVRTITMLFGTEITQTQRYLAEDSVRTRGVRWGMSLDMTGEDTKKTGGTFLIEKMPDPSAVWTRGDDKHSEWGGEPLKIEDLTPHYFNDVVLGRCLDQAAVTDWVVRTNPFEGGSDHTPFLRFKKPGVLLWHFTDVYYHTDGDRLDKVSAAEMANVGTCALVTALTLTSADGATTRALVDEVESAALARLATERALSTQVLASNGDLAHEALILRTWSDWYARALTTMEDIQVGGADADTRRAIDSARARVVAAGDDHVSRLRRLQR
jgi:aminopeptidase YwaD